MTEKREKSALYVLAILVILIAMMVSPAGALAAGTLSIGEVSVPQGCSVQVPITITNAESVVSCGIDLLYDPTVVKVTGVSNSDFYTLIPNINNETGITTIGGLQLSSETGGLNSPIQVCTVTLQAIGPVYATSELGFSVRDNCTGEGNVDIPLNLQNGTFTVAPGVSMIRAPSGTLAYGQSDTFTVDVTNVTDARELWFSFMYDPTYCLVSDVQLAPGFQEQGFVEDAFVMQETGQGFADILLKFPDGVTINEFTPVVEITFRPTSEAGTTETMMHNSWYTNGTNDYNYFDAHIAGTITANGGGSETGMIRAPSGSVSNTGSSETFSFDVNGIDRPDSMSFCYTWGIEEISLSNVRLSSAAAAAGITLDTVETSTPGRCYVSLGSMAALTATTYTPLVNVDIEASTTSGSSDILLQDASLGFKPSENVSIYYPISSKTNGTIEIVPPSGKDLRGYLVDPPEYIKKYKNGSLIFDATMVIENIGTVAVTEDFKIRGELVGKSQNLTVEDDIAPGAHITYHMHMNVVPGFPRTDLVLRSDGNERFYTITTGGDLSVGDYSIGLGIDVDNAVDEINEENNYVTQKATITKPDLIPILSTELTAGLPSSGTTIQEEVVPGTYNVTYGVRNIGNVYAVPTKLNFTNQGSSTIYDVPALQPGETWTQTLTGVSIGSSAKTFSVTVNSNGAETETNTGNNTRTIGYQSYDAVTVILPKVSGSTSSDTILYVQLTNISAPVTAFSLPIKYDPSVCYVSSVTTGDHIGWSSSYGRVLLSGSNLDIQSDTEIAQITLRARADAGRSTVLDSQTDAYVKTTGGNYLNLGITRGAYTQANITDASVNLQVPTRGSEGYNQTITVSVRNEKTNPVVVDVNVTVDGTEIWSASSVPLGSYASRSYTITTWKPLAGGTYQVKAQITGDDQPSRNVATTNVVIEPFNLEITAANENYYERYYGYNKTPFINQYLSIGTYYTANQPARPNATLSIWYANGTKVDLSKNSPFDLYEYYYPATFQTYCYDYTWNWVNWYYIIPKALGTYTYSISLEARGQSDYVNGTIRVLEPFLDIKVVNSTLITDTAGDTVPFDVFNRSPSQRQSVTLTLAAGAEGRTLNGLEQLVSYPHGCPEQTMSPALAVLRVKQYYEQRGALTDAMNATFQQNMRDAIARMSAPDGYNAQQLTGEPYGDGSGGWAWGKNSYPSAFYTLYPDYVITELLNDNDPAYWGSAVAFTPDEIDLNASANWLIQRQKSDGRWSEYGYIYNDVEWTGFISETLANEYPYLNATMQGDVDAALEKSLTWLQNHNYNSEYPQAVAHGIYGLVAIRKHGGIGDPDEINGTIADLQTRLLNQKKTGSGGSYYWYYGTEATGHAVLALNRSGLIADNETITGGLSYLLAAKGSWGWGSTRTTAVVVNTLTQVQPHATIDFTVNAELRNGDGDSIWSQTNVPFDEAHFQYVYTLTPAQAASLYDTSSADSVAQVIISGKSDAEREDKAKLFVEVKSFEQVPQSIAIRTIPPEFIDPIATDFTLDVTIPNSGYTLAEGDTADVAFTINNNEPGAVNQTTMIIEIPVNSKVNFTGSETGSNAAYYMNGPQKVYIDHMYNATDGKLYVYPGSDNEAQPSVRADESKTFYVPLTFEAYGNDTVEARAYPMYNDTWMAVGDGTTYIKGYGNITLNAVNETGAAVLADFYVGGAQVASNINATTVERVEGAYAVAIRNGTSWVNTTMTITPGDTATYTAQFVSDRSLPHISQIVGASDSARVMPPAIEETISNGSTNHWNAAVRAMESFNSSIASSGGIATIAVDIPRINRTIGTAMVNDTISVLVHNASGWFGYTDFTIGNGQLILNNVDTGDIDMIDIDFEGRKLGDADGSGSTNVLDALAVAKSTIGRYTFSGNGQFYGDVDDSGRINVLDALAIAKRTIGRVDNNYQPV